MTRILAFAYGLVSYLVFFATFLYAIGFLGNFLVPKAIDSTPVGPFGEALLINVLLLAAFAVQHSGMARPTFKRWWTRIVPEPIERATYVLFSVIVMLALMAFWQPIGGTVWHFESGPGYAIGLGAFALGIGLVLYSTMLIDHFELFGLRQTVFYALGRAHEPPVFASAASTAWSATR